MSRPDPSEAIQIDTSDDESIYDEESVLESSQSFASSVRDYLYENGRRYHAYRQGKYPLPNDEREQDRLDLVHYLWKELVNGSLYRAPISPSNTHRILDFGTGTGNWAFEMAEAFPHAEIVGTDLSPIQPVWCPPNCRFFIDDVESEWTFLPHEAFDYIHGRVMAGSISDWDRLLSQIYAHLKPGGWVELQEYECSVWSDDGTHQRVEAFHEWARKVNDASIRFGKPVNVADILPQKIRDARFVDVTNDVYKCPIGSWPKDPRLKQIGRIHLYSVLEAIEPYTLAFFTRVLGYTYEEAQADMVQVRKDVLDSSNHLYSRFHFIYARKPLHET